MRVLHVVKTLAREYGGPARSVQGLVAALEAAGVEAWLVAIEDGDNPWVEGVRHYRHLGTHGLIGLYGAFSRVVDEIRPDIIHTHDCWMPCLHVCHVVARAKKIPYVISPRGSLKAWSIKHKWLKKKIALMTYEGYDLRHALALHVTADDEREQVASLRKNDVIIQVPNGVNVPPDHEVDKLNDVELRYTQKRRALFLSRIHYTKGLMNLVEAWARVANEGWELEIAGTDADGYQKEVIERVHELGISDCVIFSGPVSDEAKWRKYAAAELLVHPSFTENFGIVVAEALWAGVPVITTRGAPWRDLENTKSGWWIDIGVEPLVAALKTAMALSPEELRAMGMRGHAFVAEHYLWPRIGSEMAKQYWKLLHG